MGHDSVGCAVALDGGTTNTRARLWRDGRIIATARRPVGVRDQVLNKDALSLASAVREVIAEVLSGGASGAEARPEFIVAAGMLTADVGLVPIPHVLAPAGLEELSKAVVERHLPAIQELPIRFVTGIRTTPAPGEDGWASADVMRGEECETLGAWLELRPQGECAFFWPGSHSKLVRVNAKGQITGSTTTLAGEMTSALAQHTLLASSVPETLPSRPDLDAVAMGMRMVGRYGLGRTAFLVRIGQLLGNLPDPQQRAAFWIGAVIGNDVAELLRSESVAPGIPLFVGGRQPQRGLYADCFRTRWGGAVTELDEDVAERCSATGAILVASRMKR